MRVAEVSIRGKTKLQFLKNLGTRLILAFEKCGERIILPPDALIGLTP